VAGRPEDVSKVRSVIRGAAAGAFCLREAVRFGGRAGRDGIPFFLSRFRCSLWRCHLERARDVEDRLDAGRYDADGRAAKLNQIGRHVHRNLAATVHAADAARDEDGDPGAMREQHRRRDGGGAVAAPCHDGGQVAARALGHLLRAELRQPLKLRRGETHEAHAVQHRDRSR